MKGRKRLAITLLVLGIGFTGASAATASPDSDPWVKLDSGRVGAYTWTAAANRIAAAGASGARGRRPCLEVGAMWRTGPLTYFRQRYRTCAPSPGRPSSSQEPLIAVAAQPSNGAPVKMTAVGMLVPAAVRRLEVTLADGAGKSIPLRTLSPSQAHATSLGGYRYAAFVVRGAWCAERIVTEGADGQALWDSGLSEYPCG